MYSVYEYDDYFRHAILPYKYVLFYNVYEEEKIIKIHRILHGMRDVKSIMRPENS